VLITGNSGGHLGLLRGKIQRFRLVLGQIGDAAALTEFTKPTSPGQCSSQGSLASDGGLRETCWPFVTVESDRGLAPLTGTGNVQWVRPAELVIKSLPSSSGLPQSWHCSAELMSPLWNSLSGAFQLWIGPRRIRHSNPFGGVAGRVVMKPNLLGAAGPGSYAEAADLVFSSVSPQSSENYGRSREFALAREQGAMSLGGKLSTRIAAFWDTPQFAMQSI
jgi:hypothetical protein